jgi:hypothetical protein
MHSQTVLPNVIVIGAKKSGTTSLYHYLASHPDISMSREKELDFFVAERNWSRGLSWYQRQFDGHAPVRGEASPYYTALPQHRGVPQRMAGIIPDARLVYLVRDPIERLISHYHMGVATGRERRSLPDAVADLSESWYVAQGRYWMQLEPYLSHFPPEQVLVVDQDELARGRAAAMRRVFAFLGVDADFVSPAFHEVHFSALPHRRRRGADKAVLALSRALGDERSYNLRRRVPAPLRALLTAPLERPALEPPLRARLEQLYAPDTARLREYTGLRFESWSV